MQLISAQRKER